jgi:hypothetical protein
MAKSKRKKTQKKPKNTTKLSTEQRIQIKQGRNKVLWKSSDDRGVYDPNII